MPRRARIPVRRLAAKKKPQINRRFSKTKSVCPVCLAVIDAWRTVGEDGRIYLEKSCPLHGDFSALIWDGPFEEYKAWGRENRGNTPKVTVPALVGCPRDCGLCENHESTGCCVLLELTSRCNLCCPVCFASSGERGRDTSVEEIEGLYDMLMSRGGPFNIQLSGGEPTVRDDLPQIIALGREKGFTFFQLNTNGLRLAEEQGYAKTLDAAGLSCVFLQFDGVTETPNRILRGRDLLKIKLAAIAACKEAGLSVVLVPTVAPGVNDCELGAILDFALSLSPTVRGVHFQPISYFGRCALKAPLERLTIPKMLRLIEEQTGGRMKKIDFGGGGAESPYCSFHASYRAGEDGTFKALVKRQDICCCVKSSQARDTVAWQWGNGALPAAGGVPGDTASLDAFLEQARTATFTVSGMLFQDAFTLDLERLRRCYICEADLERGMVPFCAYNLTDLGGRALYRK
ncbi:Coenzyme PQQ synthesis protein E [bioreactor metagenome]|uniref:Coenzyme PQQ synthesis protein E n=1 Tax=bioreactor metagenome TaxID=1076179 RepID=A0A644XHU9_9ZZZZ